MQHGPALSLRVQPLPSTKPTLVGEVGGSAFVPAPALHLHLHLLQGAFHPGRMEVASGVVCGRKFCGECPER
jgi:hypothetical protein